MEKGEVYYRYEQVRYASFDPFDEYGYHSSFGKTEIVRREYRVVKRTPKGAWIELYPGRNRFVKNEGVKKFAHPDEESARAGFLARKRRQIKILSGQLADAKIALETAKSKWKKDTELSKATT